MADQDVVTRTFKSRPLDEKLLAKIRKRLDCPSDSDAIRKALKHAAIQLGLEQER